MKLLNSVFLSLLIYSSACFVVWGQTPAKEKAQARDKVRAVKVVTGRTLGFETGDYVHVEIRASSGKKISLFIWRPGLDYFLAVYKGKPSTLTYEVADTYIPEAGSVMRIERLISARVGAETYEKRWKQVTAKYSQEEIDRRYGPLVEKYQLR